MRSGRTSWILDSVLLTGLTALLILPLFKTEYNADWGIIDGTFISDGRFLRENLPYTGWQPNWYCGNRFDYIYPPGLRYGTALVSDWVHVSAARGYHIYTAFFYCLGIAGVYCLMRAGSGSRFWAWIAALLATLASPSLLFLKHFRDGYQHHEWMPVRYGVLALYGEGPHTAAMALLAFALAAAWLGLRRGQVFWLAISAFLCAVAVLNNFYGATALAIVFPVMVWTIWMTERDWWVTVRSVALAALALGLTAFWLTPSYLRLTIRNMPLVSSPPNAWSLWLDLAVLVAIAFAIFKLGYGRPERAWALFIGGAFLRLALQVLGHHFIGFRVMGEPERLVPEFDQWFLMAGCLVLAWLCTRFRWGKLVAAAVLVAAVWPSSGFVWHSRRYPGRDLKWQQRVEYKMTRWMHENMPGSRAMATGSLRFWYNTWFDLPQVGGVSEQGLQNLQTNAAHERAIYSGDPEITTLWLQAVGTDAFLVHDKRSQEIYHDVAKPEVFAGKLEALYDDGEGNFVYRIPRRYPGLARVVDASRITLAGPVLDKDNLPAVRAYAQTVEDYSPRPAIWRRESPDRVRVTARLEPNEKLLVQETYDPYWKATTAGGREVPVSADPLGFQLLDPGPGDHDITLQFTTPLENRVGRVVTLVTIVIFLALLISGWRRPETKR